MSIITSWRFVDWNFSQVLWQTFNFTIFCTCIINETIIVCWLYFTWSNTWLHNAYLSMVINLDYMVFCFSKNKVHDVFSQVSIQIFNSTFSLSGLFTTICCMMIIFFKAKQYFLNRPRLYFNDGHPSFYRIFFSKIKQTWVLLPKDIIINLNCPLSHTSLSKFIVVLNIMIIRK